MHPVTQLHHFHQEENMQSRLFYRVCLIVLSLILLLGTTAWQDVTLQAATPSAGLWSGTTSEGHPMSFMVTPSGAQWSEFVLETYFVATDCYGVGVTLEISVPGPGNITTNQFSYNSLDYDFSGQFTSASSASGTFSFSDYQILISLPFPPYVCFDHMTKSGTWTASQATPPVTVSGNAGVAGATLTYADGTTKTVSADGSGNYSISVPSGWSGTVTPSKPSYTFSPASRMYSNVTTSLSGQNYTATLSSYVISGNTGVAGVPLSYTDGVPKTVTSNANGNYSIPVPYGWSGTMTPSRTGYTFSPANRTYSNVTAPQPGQNYTAIPIMYTISGNTRVGSATLSYTDGVPKTALSDVNGNYSFQVSYNWSGKVILSKTGYIFSPSSRTYTNVLSNQPGQNYTALVTISGSTVVAGATLGYTDGIAKTVTSLADGSYSLLVTYNWSGTVTPSHACYTFSPLSKNYSNVTANQTAQNYTPAFKPGSGCADISAVIGGSNQGRFGLPAGASTRVNFAGVNNGPVQIVSNNAVQLIAAERLIYKVNGVNTSFSEMMGLSNNQIDTTYWLPWYNNVDLDTQLRIANVSGLTTSVHIYIGGVEMTGSPFNLAAGVSTRKSFAGVNNGPVKIVSTQNIVAAERLIYKVNGLSTSFTEMMALPNNQVNTTYWLPWYNNVDLDTQLRIANVGNSTASVHIYIGGVEMTGSPFNLAAGVSTRKSFAGINNGPVQIVSTQNIVAAERLIYAAGGINTSFSEMMALPNGQLNTTYWLPWYNNVDLDTQLRIANVSGSTASVHIYIGGMEMPGSPFNLAAGVSTRKSFAGLNNGPVQIVSTQNIVAAERVIYNVNNINTSFTEMMGLADNLLNITYWLPWYNNIDLDTQLRLGVPQ
jgi:hypothetical protein